MPAASMSHPCPSFSVIVPTYNRADFVGAAVESVLGQTNHDFELIVVDDGSTDRTRESLARYGDRIRYVYQPNAGPAAARNRGIALARGQYLAFLDSDDLFLPGRLEAHAPPGARLPEVGLFWSRSVFFRDPAELPRPDARTGRVRVADLFEDLLLWRAQGLLINGLTVRAECFRQVGLFDETLPLAEDYDMWLRIAARYPVAFADVIVAGCRIHDGQRDQAGFGRGQRQAALARVLEKVSENLPPGRDPERVRQLLEQRRALLAAYRAQPLLWAFQEQLAETVTGCAAVLEAREIAAGAHLLADFRARLPHRYGVLRARLRASLAYRYAGRGLSLAGDGKLTSSVWCGLQAVAHFPTPYMARTLGSICWRAAKGATGRR